jgi:hypothetical protein
MLLFHIWPTPKGIMLVTFKVFSIEVESSTHGASRIKRRALLSPDALKCHKLVAGDWVVIENTSGDSAKLAVRVWPQADIEDDSELTI